MTHQIRTYGSIHDKAIRQRALKDLTEFLTPKQHASVVEAFHNARTEREVSFIMQGLEILAGVSGYPVRAAAVEYSHHASFVLEGRKAS